MSAVTLTMALGPALAADVAEFTTVTNDAGEPLYEYASSWCNVSVGESVDVTLVDLTGGTVLLPQITEVHLKNYDKPAGKKEKNAVTPNREPKGKMATIMYAVVPPASSVNITLMSVSSNPDWHTVHVRLKLDNGELLGVNLHSMPCDSTPETT